MASAPPKYRPANYKPTTYQATRNKAYDRTAWRKYRLTFLSAKPLCAMHLNDGELVPAAHVDHIEPVADEFDPLFWEPTNHQGLCAKCHGRKTELDSRAGKNRRRA